MNFSHRKGENFLTAVRTTRQSLTTIAATAVTAAANKSKKD
jgi:hypothetical protein